MKKLFCAVCLICLAAALASAEDAYMPLLTEEIGEEAFAGDTSVGMVLIPEGTLTVGRRAFAGCSELDVAFIEGGTEIGEDAFAGCDLSFQIRTYYGSPAHRYAVENGLDYQADTRYRALLVGNGNYPGTKYDLLGPGFDIVNMENGLTDRMYGTYWEVTVRRDLTADGIIDAIGTCFAGATDADVSLFYYSGHGFGGDGDPSSLAGVDYSGCDATNLRRAFDRVPGRKVIIIDACYSGGLLIDSVTTADAAEGEVRAPAADAASSFVSGLISPFARRSRDALTGSEYFVMAACSAEEVSWEYWDGAEEDPEHFGLFTSNLLIGLGWNVPGGGRIDPAANRNNDGAISFSEAFDFAFAETLRISREDYELDPENGSVQTAACYPANCEWFAPFRFR